MLWTTVWLRAGDIRTPWALYLGLRSSQPGPLSPQLPLWPNFWASPRWRGRNALNHLSSAPLPPSVWMERAANLSHLSLPFWRPAYSTPVTHYLEGFLITALNILMKDIQLCLLKFSAIYKLLTTPSYLTTLFFGFHSPCVLTYSLCLTFLPQFFSLLLLKLRPSTSICFLLLFFQTTSLRVSGDDS